MSENATIFYLGLHLVVGNKKKGGEGGGRGSPGESNCLNQNLEEDVKPQCWLRQVFLNIMIGIIELKLYCRALPVCDTQITVLDTITTIVCSL